MQYIRNAFDYILHQSRIGKTLGVIALFVGFVYFKANPNALSDLLHFAIHDIIAPAFQQGVIDITNGVLPVAGQLLTIFLVIFGIF